MTGQDGLAGRRAAPGSTECGLRAGARPGPPLPPPDPTVALYLFGSCFGDWVGPDRGPRMCAELRPPPRTHLPSLSLPAAPQPGAGTASQSWADVLGLSP